MEREYKDYGASFGEMTHIAQSDGEFQQLSRVYGPLPHTHQLVVTVEGRRFTVRPELKPEFAAPPAPAAAPAPHQPQANQPNPEIASLEGKDKKDLITIGAELGLQLSDKQSKAAIIAEIVKAQQERQANA